MEFHAELGKPIAGQDVWARAPGFVRAEAEFRSDRAVTRAGETGTLDIRIEEATPSGEKSASVPLVERLFAGDMAALGKGEIFCAQG